jgi:endonuclease/exonuclease/phosphatase family metal-dependent hydrolase
MKICTYNILVQKCLETMKEGDAAKFESWDSRSNRLVQKICDVAADVICLQEVQGQTHFNDMARLLADRGYYGVYTSRNNGEEEGLATLYRHAEFNLTSESALYFDDGTGRFVTSVKISPKDGSGDIRVLNTHLQWGSEQLDEANKVVKFANSHFDAPLVICGDFNCTREEAPYRVFLAQFGDSCFVEKPLATFLEDKDEVRYDGMLSHGLFPFKTDVIGDVQQTKRGEPSDHLPLVTTFERTSAYKERLENIAQLFRQKDFANAIKDFETLPLRIQEHAFWESYCLVNNKVQIDRLGQKALYGQVSFEDEDRAKAIENTLVNL